MKFSLPCTSPCRIGNLDSTGKVFNKLAGFLKIRLDGSHLLFRWCDKSFICIDTCSINDIGDIFDSFDSFRTLGIEFGFASVDETTI